MTIEEEAVARAKALALRVRPHSPVRRRTRRCVQM